LPLAFAAGMLTILSPCVLPLAPIVIASARARDSRGPLALGLGLALAFGVVGGVLASLGVVFGDSAMARATSAAIMVAIGAALLFPSIGRALERRAGFASRGTELFRHRLPNPGLVGQIATGVVLAFAWAPCAGPILGAALLLGASGGSRAAVISTMTAYGLGAAGALIAVGYGIGRLASKARVAAAGARGRLALGAAFALTGAAILTGLDRPVEAALASAMPGWLVTLATSL
jgi:cytochrome c biogenesis protein CcdA